MNTNNPKSGPNSPVSIDTSSDYLAKRIQELKETDSQFRAALPLAEVNQAKTQPGLTLAQVVNTCMEGYAERPALAQRVTHLETDPQTGRSSRKLLAQYETISYGELWGRAKTLGSFWYHEDKHLRADEFLCIIAFGGIDFVTVQMATIHNGAVIVPLQTNGQMSQLLEIIREVEPQWLATSLESLPTAVDLILDGHTPKGLLLFDYDPEVDDHQETFEKAQARLADAGLSDLTVLLDDACRQGAERPESPLHDKPDSGGRLCTVIYTSGSTGLPKGAMLPERVVKYTWKNISPVPLISLHYMPMNHSFGPSAVAMALSQGGTVYFTAKSDLSTLFEDMALARPTFIGMVPRIAEMIYQQYKVELDRRAPGAANREALEDELILETRNKVLGGRFLTVIFSSAPSTPELRTFMQRCLGFKMTESYSSTEAAGAATFNGRVSRPTVIDYKLIDVPELGYFNTDKPYPRGELYIRSDAMFLGYFKRPEVTASVFDEAGYYKTGDIMAEIGPDELVYVDRRNNVQKLSQGEFVAIARVETAYTNGHPLIKQAYLYGSSDRSFLVGVFVPNQEVMNDMGIFGNDRAVKAALRDAINQVAEQENLLAHEVPRDFIVEYEPFSTENGLLAGIGKYQRPKFKERYSDRLETLYDTIAESREHELQKLREQGRNLPVLEVVGRAIQAALGIENLDLSKRCSFAELGGDSLTALSCSVLLEEIYQTEIPASVVNNPAGSLQQLAQYIERALDTSFKHPTFTSVHGRGATEIRASDLVLEKFIDAKTLEQADAIPGPSSAIRTVLLTGSNGFLGRFLCLEWLERMARVGGQVICLIRGEDAVSARQRLREAIDSNDSVLTDHFDELSAQLKVLPGDLGEPDLGLTQADWRQLAETVDHIVHPAAFVNHVLPYAQLFGPNVVGTAELIRLALTHHLKPINNVSTIAAAMLKDGGTVNEEDDIRTATPVRHLDDSTYASGYANSKWAAEVLLREANERFGLPVSIFRSDMIMPHSRYQGQLNIPDIFTRWLFSTVVTGLAPASYYESTPGIKPHYDGLPVDFTAAAIATLGEQSRVGYHCYHVVNPHEDGISMDTFVDWAIDAGYPISRVNDYDDWYHRFETALRALPDKQRHASSLPLIHQLKQPMRSCAGATISARIFREDVRKYQVSEERDIPHLSAGYIRKYLDDLYHVGLIDEKERENGRRVITQVS